MATYIGKRSPEPSSLQDAYDEGFDAVELYLEKEHLDNFESTLQACRDASVEIKTVHTPHVYLSEIEYLMKSNELAEELDATLVFHSGGIHFTSLDVVEREMHFSVPYGYENQPGYTPDFIEEAIFEKGRSLVLDIAHLYTGVGDGWVEIVERWLDAYSEDIPVIHLCDSTREDDGLAIGEGEMEIEPILPLIDDLDDTIVVLEVPVDKQKDALEWLNRNLE